MSGKIIISAVSLILVVGVAIGVVVAVNKKSEDPTVESHQKTIKAVCQNTEDKKLCHETMSSFKELDSSDPKAYIETAVKATMNSVEKAFNTSERLIIEYGGENNATKMALDECKNLMEFAIDSLKLSIDMVKAYDIKGFQNQDADFKNWLSAVISYKHACLESFEGHGEVAKKVQEQLRTQNLDNVTKLAVMTLNIVTNLYNILQQFGVNFELKPASRRLLADDGLPIWFSAAERKLLGGKWRKGLTPNVVVAKDGSGQFKTVGEAIASYPKDFKGRYVIYVKAGVYAEYITVPKNAVNILMYGDGPETIITGNLFFIKDVRTTPETATFVVEAEGFIAKSMTFENTAGPLGLQAVAFRSIGDRTALIECHILGYQDTLYVMSNRQFYYKCVISGTIDFIFGVSITVIQDSDIIVRKPLDSQFNVIVADGREDGNMTTGIVIQGCRIVPDPEYNAATFKVKSYLGRPWKNRSRTIIMESTIPDFIDPEGWHRWDNKPYEDTCYYAEYNNDGPGANVNGRIKWKGYHGLINREEATQFIPEVFLKAGFNNSINWLKEDLHVPHAIGFLKS